ncbi:FAD-dependent monooxygenase [Cellulosimicrobium sp. NPDC055967]|uniref:FAD-dependent monooxygenase n=1 Tax=Cellulosimicrobium sp. NPDC055967 TaxID=3345670 RepID=UPI0035D69262
MTLDVLVVGAGPVGLLTAVELRDHGLTVRVVDRATSRSTRSKATTLWPRQLELLDRAGITAELLRRGHRIDHVTFGNGRREIGRVSLAALRDTPHPYGLIVPQPVTEEVLETALATRGVVVERGVSHESVEQDDRRTVSRVVRADGTQESIEAAWLVACDGAHSPTRGRLGIPFEDDNPPVTFAITDVEIEGPVPTDALAYHYGAAGALGLVPLGGSVFRVAIGVPPDTPAEPSRELFDDALARRTGLPAVVGTPDWSATFTVRFRTAARLRHGRVLLAGDAGHIMSPAGGQGMNTGIQDAVAVAWRLAAARSASARRAADLLEEYEAERLGDARRVARLTATLTRVGLLRSPASRWVRDRLARGAGLMGLLDRSLGPRLCQLDTRYGDAGRRRSRAVRVGDRFPGSFAPGDHGFPVLATGSSTLVVWPGRRAVGVDLGAADVGARLRARHGPGTSVVVLDPRRVARDVARRLGRRSRVFVVRPDGHVAAVHPTAGDSPTEATARATARPPRTRERILR